MKNKKLNKTPSNFWNCCPIRKDYLPEDPCNLGTPQVNKNKKILAEPPCAWWINSKKHNYCFWTYIRDQSNSLGEMPEILQSDMAKLFGWSNTKAHFMLKEALENLIEVLHGYNLNIELEDIVDEFQLSDFTHPELNEEC